MTKSREYVSFVQRRKDSEEGVKARLNAVKAKRFAYEEERLKDPSLLSWGELAGTGAASALMTFYPLPFDPYAYVDSRALGRGYLIAAGLDVLIRTEFPHYPKSWRTATVGAAGAVGELVFEQPMVMRSGGMVFNPESMVPGLIGVASFLAVHALVNYSSLRDARAFRKVESGVLFSQGFDFLKRQTGIQIKFGNSRRA